MGELRKIEWVTVIACSFNTRCHDLGWPLSRDSEARTIWIAEAHRDDGKRFIVRAGKR
jgi:hypothetical protein